MAGAEIQVEVKNFNLLEHMEHALSNFGSNAKTGLLRELGQIVRRQHMKRIRAEKRAPDGPAWAPLRPATIEKKGHSEILVDSGRMASAWQLDFGPSHLKMSNTARNRRGAKYIAFHQYGTRRMVARPPMGFSEENIREILHRVERWVAARVLRLAA